MNDGGRTVKARIRVAFLAENQKCHSSISTSREKVPLLPFVDLVDLRTRLGHHRGVSRQTFPTRFILASTTEPRCRVTDWTALHRHFGALTFSTEPTTSGSDSYSWTSFLCDRNRQVTCIRPREGNEPSIFLPSTAAAAARSSSSTAGT